MDLMQPFVVPHPSANGGLIGDHAQEEAFVPEPPHRSFGPSKELQFVRVVHIPIEAHVQYAIAVEKGDWSPFAPTSKRAQCVRDGPVHASPSPHRPLRLATALL